MKGNIKPSPAPTPNNSQYSCVREFLGTMQPEDELRGAIENVFEGNFMSPEEDADLICGCFLQDKKQIDKLKTTIAFKNVRIKELEQVAKEVEKNYAKYQSTINELMDKNQTKILIIIVLVVAVVVMIPLLSIFNP